MIVISRSPYRVSLFGGGTDFPSYYEKYGGCIISFTINKYLHVIIKKRFDDSIRVSYTTTEIVNSIDEIQHSIIRECLRKTGINSGVEVVTIGDIPAGTGLGSSSCLAVGCLNAFYAYKGIYKSKEQLAVEATEIELDILKSPIGIQDQIACAVGGFKFYQFDKDKSRYENLYINDLKDKIQLFYTGITRNTNKVITNQQNQIEVLNRIQEICLEAKEHPNYYKELLRKTWKMKRQLCNVTNPLIDSYVDLVEKQNGSVKLLGAGLGGFLLTLSDHKISLPLRELEFDFDLNGTTIVLNTKE